MGSLEQRRAPPTNLVFIYIASAQGSANARLAIYIAGHVCSAYVTWSDKTSLVAIKVLS